MGRRFILGMTIALAVSLLVLGIFNSLAMRRLDASYSLLITKDLAAIGTVRQISRQSAETHRCLLNLVMKSDASETTRQKQKLHAARDANDHSAAQLISSLVGQTTNPDFEALIETRKNYNRSADELLDLIDTGDSASASVEAYRINTVRPAYEDYLRAQDQLADGVYARAEARGRDISDQSKRWQMYALGLSTWPLLLAILIIGFVASVLLWLGWRMPDEES